MFTKKNKKYIASLDNTLTETNIAPENRSSQMEMNLPTSSNHQFSGAMLVSGRVNFMVTKLRTA